ncbi:hypothetical protein [Pendulispora albinea]|uniref:Uncharacterized protein n=1 Tax=Pendulispora albinea TaxID=2741071 RepID=A0ABZ2LT63_9BACT
MELSRTREYEAEIRAYLLGRVGKRHTAGDIAPHLAPSETPQRIASWWMFEGKRYPHLEGPLARHWPLVHREATRLLGTFHSAWRVTHTPEGEVDWITSVALSMTAPAPVYRVRSTQTGLSADERACLERWMTWIAWKWRAYVRSVGVPEGAHETLPWEVTKRTTENAASLRRLAQIARRSRWSLFQSVVAETIRCFIEREELDRLPLPPGHAALFQLACMTRMLRTVCPQPEHIRWVDRKLEGNTVYVPGCRFRHEHRLRRDAVLASEPFDGGLREAMARHDVGCPERIDGWLVFDQPRRGFGGVVLEAKSGKQDVKDSIAQLRVYRATIKRMDPRPLIVWGIAEQESRPELAEHAYAQLQKDVAARSPEGGGDDVWVFSGVDDVVRITTLLVGAGESAGAGDGAVTAPHLAGP